MDPLRLRWLRAGDRYPDLASSPDHFIALDPDGHDMGVVKTVPAPGGGTEWCWSMLLVHTGEPFRRPTSGACMNRHDAARALGACYQHFRDFYRLDEPR